MAHVSPYPGHPVPRLTLLFFNAAKAPEAAETATARTAYAHCFESTKSAKVTSLIYDGSMRVGAMTRRVFSRTLGAAALSFCARTAPSTRLQWTELNTSAPASERRYRADAQVLLLGLPLFHHRGVGGGSALWRESADATGGMLRLLEFSGYSIPAQSAGLNRLGFIRELSRRTEGKSVESIYFGLMTASPEESAEQLRKALHPAAREQAYTVIDGRVVPAGSESVIAHFAAPATLSAAQQPELMERARTALAASPGASGGPAARHGEAQSFLQALAELLRHPDRPETSYVYSGRLYSLWANRADDARSAAYFRQQHLIPKDGNVIRVAGRLRRQSGGADTTFRLWVEPAAARPLPLRIEYQAKSYLRLVFEAVA